MTNLGDSAGRETVISAEGLSRRFKSLWALRDVSFEVRRGQVFLLLGHNGAGKTTFLKILLGLLRPTVGGVRVFGLDPWDYNDGLAIRARMGVALEVNGLYEKMTAWENLEIFARIYRLEPAVWKRRAEALLDSLALLDRKDDLVATWSAGMKRKLCFLRAVLHEPEILVLDEPTAGLDAVTKHTIRTVLTEMVVRKGITVIAASQDLGEAEHSATHTAFLRLGRLIYAGSINSLDDKVRIRKFWIPQGVEAPALVAAFAGAKVAGEEATWQGANVILRFHDGACPSDAELASRLPAGVTRIPVTLEDLYIELARDMGDI